MPMTTYSKNSSQYLTACSIGKNNVIKFNYLLGSQKIVVKKSTYVCYITKLAKDIVLNIGHSYQYSKTVSLYCLFNKLTKVDVIIALNHTTYCKIGAIFSSPCKSIFLKLIALFAVIGLN